ncbi:MAG: RHS repeat-associated core domain-containing protein [Acidobacteriaceae bacterium]|nr:RHS repeat-associated core domain-containing protein [Acidobacteriaceae bacterium]
MTIQPSPTTAAYDYGAPAGLFTGKERDAETGLDYFGARYFSGAQGRFTSPDAPGADQWTVNPQSWNLYGYVRNNPLRFVDPRGRECVQVSGGFNGWADDGQGTFCDKVDTGTAGSSTTVGGGDVTPVQVGWEWLTGNGPRQRTFTEEDRFTQMLRQHNHINLVIGAIQGQLGSCQTPTPQSLQAAGTNPNYSLSGIEGVPKYVGDYSTLATGGATGNLAVTYRGSYGLSFNVSNVNASAGTASVSFHVCNVSSIASGTRPPVIGYTQAYQNTVGRALNNSFSSGAMSPTQQDFFWTQQVSFNGGACR